MIGFEGKTLVVLSVKHLYCTPQNKEQSPLKSLWTAVFPEGGKLVPGMGWREEREDLRCKALASVASKQEGPQQSLTVHCGDPDGPGLERMGKRKGTRHL